MLFALALGGGSMILKSADPSPTASKSFSSDNNNNSERPSSESFQTQDSKQGAPSSSTTSQNNELQPCRNASKDFEEYPEHPISNGRSYRGRSRCNGNSPIPSGCCVETCELQRCDTATEPSIDKLYSSESESTKQKQQSKPKCPKNLAWKALLQRKKMKVSIRMNC